MDVSHLNEDEDHLHVHFISGTLMHCVPFVPAALPLPATSLRPPAPHRQTPTPALLVSPPSSPLASLLWPLRLSSCRPASVHERDFICIADR